MRQVMIVALLAVAVSSAYAESDFHYKIPDGWVNLATPGSVADNVPAAVKTEAASGKYAVYAGDPERMSRQSVPVSFNVVEMPSTGRVTEAVLTQGAAQMRDQLSRTGAKVEILETKVIKLDGVDIGVVGSTMETQRGSLRLLQYMIPGKTHLAVLTYGCPPADFAHYQPIFESSAMATTGAFDHSAFDLGYKFGRIWVFGAFGAVVAVIITLVNAGKAKNKAMIPVQPSTPIVWDCPNCKRRVPMRLTECRCGTLRPA